MTENMSKFLELASRDEALRKRLENLSKMPEEEANKQIAALAAENGICLEKADFTPAAREIDEDELDAVAGGAVCYCVGAGGGSGGRTDAFTSDNCVCVLGGAGEGFRPNTQNPQAIHKVSRCQCVIGGQGDDCEL